MGKHRNGKVRNFGNSEGLSRHRKSGKTTKSPKLRYAMRLEAQKVSIKAPESLPHRSVGELFK